MKLRNKKTGEIKELPDGFFCGDNLKKVCEEWEDYKEPKEYWYYDTTKNGVEKITHLEDKEKDQAIGNYFETKEEAEKAVEKLKAWKRLKDNGFKFEGLEKRGRYIKFYQGRSYETEEQCIQAGIDLDLLFSQEDD